MISEEINTNNEENKPVKKLTNDFFKIYQKLMLIKILGKIIVIK